MSFFRLITAIALILSAYPVFAQESPIPDRRSIAFENTDFYGGDIRTILETTLDMCERACLDDSSCSALTFNQIKGACFLKNSVGERSFFDGALSMIIVNATPDLVARGALRQQDLGWLPDGYLARATRRAMGIGRQYPVNDTGMTELELRFESAMADDSYADALIYAARMLSFEDTGENWLIVAELSAEIAMLDSQRASNMRSLARDAAINAYLRSGADRERAKAMVVLAHLLEEAREGRRSIDALRLAQRLDWNENTEKALNRALGLFGFRVTDTQVDNNAERPRICLNFNEPLVELGVDYSSFIRVVGENLPVEAEGEQLCLDGVTHGVTYEITLRAGLPAASGEVLQSSVRQTIYVRDRDPSVHFIGRSYVLPMSQNPAIPVVTVNASEVELKLFRVGERNLVPTLLDGVMNNPLATYSEENLANTSGEALWTGIGTVGNTLNKNVITALPLAAALQSYEPGIYAMTARLKGQGEPWEEAATQWFIVSDLGIETMLGADGLHVFARSLRSATPLSGLTARLVALNNTVLFEAKTDAQGYALMPEGFTRGEGGQGPAMLQLVSDSGDFAFIDLNSPAMDLSDRGVAGRAAPEEIDIFASFERGAYRPGETVFATILARDPAANATLGLPLTAVLFRPDGVEHSKTLLTDTGAGGRIYEKNLPLGAMRGTWRLKIYADPESANLKTLAFLVEDFVPERIDFELSMEERAFKASEIPDLSISAKYLYGAPAAGLSVEGEVEITAVQELDGFEGYQFGLADEPFIEGYQAIETDRETDSEGNLTLALVFPTMEPVTKLLQMRATVRMSDGSGRPVERSLIRALLPDGPRIGVKPLFDGALREGAEAAFELIAIDAAAQQMPMPAVSWTLSRIERNYQWYRYNGRWNWEPMVRKVRVASGEVDLLSTSPIRIATAIDWGHYELKLVSLEGGYTASSFTFNSGWWSADASSDTPDVLDVSLDKARYEIGDIAKLRMTPRAAGTVLVRVISDRLISMQALDVAAGEQVVEVPVEEDWGAGAYIVATLIQPMDEGLSRNPARAVGLAYAPTDPSAHMLSARFDMPAEMAPRGPLEVKLKVEGMGANTAYATIAAVDVGILNLTGFESPAPTEYYFGQQRLGMELRDIYGRLIDGMQGTPGLLRSGGDGALARVNAPPPTQELVAYFSGPIEIGADGIATARFDLPAFNGTVRLMAVVWTDTAVGQAEYDLLVRDPVVVSAAAPRFLAPGDSTRLRVDIANVAGPAGNMTVALDLPDSLLAQNMVADLQLESGGKGRVAFALQAIKADDAATVTLVVTDAAGQQYRQEISLPVRANGPLVYRNVQASLAANGGRFEIGADAFADFTNGSASGSFALGPLAKFNVAGMLDALDRSPWGGTETQISRAMPLLYMGEIAEAMALDTPRDVARDIDTAIEAVLANQSSSGSFGQWRPDSGDLWLDAFATDFLSRARQEGHPVPERAFTQALANLRNALNYARDFENAGQGIAYALMVLAREGQASIGDLRYYADVKAPDFATPMALAQLGAGLAYSGDQVRADKLFALAYGRVKNAAEDDRQYRSDYGSQRRDMAALLTLASEAHSTAVDFAALARQVTQPKRRYSSQERLWQLLAARALLASPPTPARVDGTILEGPQVVYFDEETLALGPITIENPNAVPLDGLLTITGTPDYNPPAEQAGYRMDRWLYTLDGEPADLTAIAQNQRYVMIVRVTPEQERRGRLIISDPLAAGFEIDSPNLLRSGDISKLDWLQLDDISEATEFRADRFVSALEWSQKGSFQMGYIVRAVTPGVYQQPPASVEDMYRPSLRATTPAHTITILPAE